LREGSELVDDSGRLKVGASEDEWNTVMIDANPIYWRFENGEDEGIKEDAKESSSIIASYVDNLYSTVSSCRMNEAKKRKKLYGEVPS